jgi:hypothetical protein
MLNKAE